MIVAWQLEKEQKISEFQVVIEPTTFVRAFGSPNYGASRTASEMVRLTTLFLNKVSRKYCRIGNVNFFNSCVGALRGRNAQSRFSEVIRSLETQYPCLFPCSGASC